MSQVTLSKKLPFLLVLIVFVGFALRVWGINFGLPYQFHQDEPIVVNHALAYGTGDFNPRFFAIPPFASYILFMLYGLVFVLGWVIGAWQSTYDFAVSFFRDPSIFYLVGRFFIGVLPGTACIFLTYRLAKRFLTKNAALYAAAIMSFSFLNVINSHYIYTDMLLTFFILLAYERLFLLFHDPKTKNYCAAGLVIGLAVGAKYNGAILVIPYFLSHYFSEKRSFFETIFSKKLWLGFLCSFAGFVAVNPFFILDFKGFLSSFMHQSGAFCYTGWTHHIVYSLFQGVSAPITVLGIAGIVLFVFSRDKWQKVIAAFPVTLYAVLIFKSQHFSRYVIFLVPFIAIGAGYILFDRVGNVVKRYRSGKVIAIFAAILLVPTTFKSLKADILFTSIDTRVIAADWIRENIPEGSKIVCDSTNFRPVIPQPYSQLAEKKKTFSEKEGDPGPREFKLDLMIEASDKGKKGYPIYFLYENPEAQGQFMNTLPALPYDVEVILSDGIEYIVVNNQIFSLAKDCFLQDIEGRTEVVKDFSPYTDDVYRGTFDPLATTYMAVSDKDVFMRRKIGPALRIYRIVK